MSENGNPLLEVDDVYKTFKIGNDGWLEGGATYVHAINGVKLDIRKGESFCLVGESGCGKSTLARTVMGLEDPTSGTIAYDGTRIDNVEDRERLPYRRKMQMIFQNPYASLNPRMKIKQALEEPLRFHHPNLKDAEVLDKVHAIMESVGNDPKWCERFPHEFSGGQRQRISIARALMVDPEFIVADEPISALDVSIQAQVLNVMMDAQEKHNLTYLFITHDLSVVEHFGTRVGVMYLGVLCELANTRSLFASPRHPYTQGLLAAIPKMDGSDLSYTKMDGEVPTAMNLPSGCVFHTRCPLAQDRCRSDSPELRDVEGHKVACHFAE